MGLLRSLVTLPLTAPLQGTLWLAKGIQDAAQAEMTDPAAIRRALAALEADLEAGVITEDEYDAAEDILFARLAAGGATQP